MMIIIKKAFIFLTFFFLLLFSSTDYFSQTLCEECEECEADEEAAEGGEGEEVGGEVGEEVGIDIGEEGAEVTLESADVVGAEVGGEVGAEVGAEVGGEVGAEVGIEVGLLAADAIPGVGEVLMVIEGVALLGVALYEIGKYWYEYDDVFLDALTFNAYDFSGRDSYKTGHYRIPIVPSFSYHADDLSGKEDTLSYIFYIKANIDSSDVKKYVQNRGMTCPDINGVRKMTDYLPCALVDFTQPVPVDTRPIMEGKRPDPTKRDSVTRTFAHIKLRSQDDIKNIRAEVESNYGFDGLRMRYENQNPYRTYPLTSNQITYVKKFLVESDVKLILSTYNKQKVGWDSLAEIPYTAEELYKGTDTALIAFKINNFSLNKIKQNENHRNLPLWIRVVVESSPYFLPKKPLRPEYFQIFFPKADSDDDILDFMFKKRKKERTLFYFKVLDYVPVNDVNKIKENNTPLHLTSRQYALVPEIHIANENELSAGRYKVSNQVTLLTGDIRERPALKTTYANGKNHFSINICHDPYVNGKTKLITNMEINNLTGNSKLIIKFKDLSEIKRNTSLFNVPEMNEFPTTAYLRYHNGKKEDVAIYDLLKNGKPISSPSCPYQENFTFLLPNIPFEVGDFLSIKTYYKDETYAKRTLSVPNVSGNTLPALPYHIKFGQAQKFLTLIDGQQTSIRKAGKEVHFENGISLESNPDPSSSNWYINYNQLGHYTIVNPKNNMALAVNQNNKLILSNKKTVNSSNLWRIVFYNENTIALYHSASKSFINSGLTLTPNSSIKEALLFNITPSDYFNLYAHFKNNTNMQPVNNGPGFRDSYFPYDKLSTTHPPILEEDLKAPGHIREYFYSNSNNKKDSLLLLFPPSLYSACKEIHNSDINKSLKYDEGLPPGLKPYLINVTPSEKNNCHRDTMKYRVVFLDSAFDHLPPNGDISWVKYNLTYSYKNKKNVIAKQDVIFQFSKYHLSKAKPKYLLNRSFPVASSISKYGDYMTLSYLPTDRADYISLLPKINDGYVMERGKIQNENKGLPTSQQRRVPDPIDFNKNPGIKNLFITFNEAYGKSYMLNFRESDNIGKFGSEYHLVLDENAPRSSMSNIKFYDEDYFVTDHEPNPSYDKSNEHKRVLVVKSYTKSNMDYKLNEECEVNSLDELRGSIMGTTSSKNAFDNNISTHFGGLRDRHTGLRYKDQWTGIRFIERKPIPISKIRFRPFFDPAKKDLAFLGEFQISDTSSFSKYQVIYVMDTHKVTKNQYYCIDLQSGKQAYKGEYLRYLSPDGFENVAEIDVYSDPKGYELLSEDCETDHLEKLSGNIIGVRGHIPSQAKDKAFDNDITTFYQGSTSNYSWVGLDFGEQKPISHIRFKPRTGYANRMIGGEFHISDNPEFSESNLMYKIPDDKLTVAGAYYCLTLKSGEEAYQGRYIRYFSPYDGWGNVAEIDVYRTNK